MPKLLVWKSALVLLCLVFLTILFALWYTEDTRIAREHGPMEMLQAIWLVVGTVAVAGFALRATDPGPRCLLSAMFLFYLTFLLLEFDVRTFGKPLLNLLLNGTVRNAWVGIAWAAVAWCIWRNAASTRRAAQTWLRSYSAALLAISGLFWIGGAGFEKAPWLSGSKTFFAEELMEVNATFLMALAGFQARRGFAEASVPVATPGTAEQTAPYH